MAHVSNNTSSCSYKLVRTEETLQRKENSAIIFRNQISKQLRIYPEDGHLSPKLLLYEFGLCVCDFLTRTQNLNYHEILTDPVFLAT